MLWFITVESSIRTWLITTMNEIKIHYSPFDQCIGVSLVSLPSGHPTLPIQFVLQDEMCGQHTLAQKEVLQSHFKETERLPRL